MKSALLITLLCLFVCDVQAQTRLTRVSRPANHASVLNSTDTLPIRRVVLYSNGVAYIERRGRINGRAEVNLSFKQSQVDDVLKSMVVLDLGNGRIGAVSYNSSTPAAARMSEIPFAIAAATNGNNNGGLAGVLAQLQGARVAVSIGTRIVTGAVITVEARPSQMEPGKPSSVHHRLVIATDTGELSEFDLADVRSVKLVEEGTRRDLSEFAFAAASARRRDAKTIVVTSDGLGERELVVSYIIAAPIWKTTYRVVLDRTGVPFFQGWAIVDNVSEEDWTGVRLSLVSGTPISFIQPIQNPVYRHRPIIPLPERLNLRPQVHEPGLGAGSGRSGSLSGQIKDSLGAAVAGANVVITNAVSKHSFNVTTDPGGFFNVSNLPAGTYTVDASAPGFKVATVSGLSVSTGQRSSLDVSLDVGSVSETVTITAEAPNVQQSSNFTVDGALNLEPGITGRRTLSNLIAGASSGVNAAATTSDLGDLFEYHIDQPVSVQRDRSALIPILQTRLEGERVSIYNESAQTTRPLSGLILKNTSALTLEDGSLTVLDGDAYAGEALMQRLKPGEQRLVSFALDLGTLVTARTDENRTPTFMVQAVNGVIRAHYYEMRKKVYTFVNQTDRARTIYLEHPIDGDWELGDETVKPETTTGRHYRFRVSLEPNQRIDFPVTERQELWESYTLTNITRRDLELFIIRRYIDDQSRAALERILDLKDRLTTSEARLQSQDKEVADISQDQQRLRENIKALTQGTLTSLAESRQLITRYIAKANDQESRLEQINKTRAETIEEIRRLRSEVDTAIRTLTLERKVT